MEDRVITKHRILAELAELHWLMARLEEMKDGECWTEQMPGHEKENRIQSLSSQFFLRLTGSVSR